MATTTKRKLDDDVLKDDGPDLPPLPIDETVSIVPIAPIQTVLQARKLFNHTRDNALKLGLARIERWISMRTGRKALKLGQLPHQKLYQYDDALRKFDADAKTSPTTDTAAAAHRSALIDRRNAYALWHDQVAKLCRSFCSTPIHAEIILMAVISFSYAEDVVSPNVDLAIGDAKSVGPAAICAKLPLSESDMIAISMLTNRLLQSVFGLSNVWSTPDSELKIEPSPVLCLERHDCCCLSKATADTAAVVADVFGPKPVPTDATTDPPTKKLRFQSKDN